MSLQYYGIVEEYSLTSSQQTHIQAHREIKFEKNSGLPGVLCGIANLVVVLSLPVLKADEV